MLGRRMLREVLWRRPNSCGGGWKHAVAYYYRLPGESEWTTAYYCGVPRVHDAILRPRIPHQARVQPGLQVHSGRKGKGGLRFTPHHPLVSSVDEGISVQQKKNLLTSSSTSTSSSSSSSSSSSPILVVGNQSWSSGRHYFEFEVLQGGTSASIAMVGIIPVPVPVPAAEAEAEAQAQAQALPPRVSVSEGNIRKNFPGTRGTQDGLAFQEISSSEDSQKRFLLGVEVPYTGDKVSVLLDFYYHRVTVFRQARFLWDEAEGQLVLQEGVAYAPAVLLTDQTQCVKITDFERRA